MAKAESMTKEKLQDEISKAIRPLIDRFKAQKSESALKAETDIAEIEKLAARLGDDSPAVKALQRAIDSLGYDPATDERRRLEEAAFAVVAVCNEVRVPVQIKKRAGRGSGRASGGTRTRRSAEELEKQTAAVLAALPSNSKDFRSTAEIKSESGVDDVGYVLRRLVSEGKAESNGKRGAGGGYRKAAKS